MRRTVRRVAAVRQYRRFLAITLTVAMVVGGSLRFAGIGFGNGALNARPDEEVIRSSVLNSLAGDWNPHYAVWGHVYHYAYVALGAVYLAWNVGTGAASSWWDAVAAAHCAPSTFDLLGRSISGAAGTATILVTYCLARRVLRNRLAAACSCIVLATMFLHVRDSHFCTSDVLLTLTTTAALTALSSSARGRVRRAGLWCGLSLATKLLALVAVVTCLTQLVIERILRKRSEICWPATVLLGTAGITALLLQPFLLLDPRETYFGLFGDLFNPERHPFERGLHGVNASIIVLYYLPHGMGWIVGGLAVVGGLHLLYWGRVTARWILFAFVFWSLLALLSVERIFLRYLDPLLPVVSVMAGHAVAAAARRVASGEKRLVISVAAVVAAASPNLLRDVVLDHRLSQRDSRALAGDWIVQNVPPGSRILWTGFGQTPPHLTMPRLQMCAEHDERLVALRAARGLPTRVDHAIMEWKKLRSAPCYDLQSLSIGSSNGEQRSFEAFPFVDHQYDLGCLEAIDRWSRSLGWLIGETPRVDLVHRFLAGVVSKDLQDLANGNEPILVVTGMPADPQLLQSLAPWFEQVQEFSPGHSASALYRQGAYDQGDAWFLPNLSLHRVDRPGVDIHVFRRRSQ